MPYSSVEELPPPVRQHLPDHAQEIFRAAFNNAYHTHEGDPRQEEISFKTAWAAVKRAYVKVDENWVPKATIKLRR